MIKGNKIQNKKVVFFGLHCAYSGTRFIKLPVVKELVKEYGKIQPVVYIAGERKTKKLEKSDLDYLQKNYEPCLEVSNLKSIYNFFKSNQNVIVFTGFPEMVSYLPMYFILTILNIKYYQFKNTGAPFFNSIDMLMSIKNQTVFSKYSFVKRVVSGKIFTYSMKLGLIYRYEALFYAGKNQQDKYKGYGLYKNLVLTNTHNYDSFVASKLNIEKKYVVFLDSSMPYNKDSIKYGVTPISREIYYNIINPILENASKILNKEIIVCAHPSCNMEDAEEDYRGKRVIQGKTEEFIALADLVIFDVTSSINTAFYAKKPILQIQSAHFNEYYTKEQDSNARMFSFIHIDSDNYLEEDLSECIKNAKNNINTNDAILQEILISYPNKDSSRKVVEWLKEYS